MEALWKAKGASLWQVLFVLCPMTAAHLLVAKAFCSACRKCSAVMLRSPSPRAKCSKAREFRPAAHNQTAPEPRCCRPSESYWWALRALRYPTTSLSDQVTGPTDLSCWASGSRAYLKLPGTYLPAKQEVDCQHLTAIAISKLMSTSLFCWAEAFLCRHFDRQDKWRAYQKFHGRA